MDKDDRYTRITLRIPKDLHLKLSDAADETSKSMNAEIIARLEESFRPRYRGMPSVADLIYSKMQDPNTTLWDAIDLSEKGNVFRLRNNLTTYDATDHLLACIASPMEIKSVVLAVRDGEANHSALSVAIYSNNLTLLADATPLTVERPPRESEVRDLIWSLDLKRLLDGPTLFRTRRVDQTQHLPVEQALEIINSGELRRLGAESLSEFLALFHKAPVTYTRAQIFKFFVE